MQTENKNPHQYSKLCVCDYGDIMSFYHHHRCLSIPCTIYFFFFQIFINSNVSLRWCFDRKIYLTFTTYRPTFFNRSSNLTLSFFFFFCCCWRNEILKFLKRKKTIFPQTEAIRLWIFFFISKLINFLIDFCFLIFWKTFRWTKWHLFWTKFF